MKNTVTVEDVISFLWAANEADLAKVRSNMVRLDRISALVNKQNIRPGDKVTFVSGKKKSGSTIYTGIVVSKKYKRAHVQIQGCDKAWNQIYAIGSKVAVPFEMLKLA